MSGSIYNEEVLDLRELILVLWRRKWLIVGSTVLAGLLAFLISSYVVPARFEASAIVTITDRNTWAALELKSLTNTAEAPDLKKEALDSLGITDLEKTGLYELSADADVRSQLILSVTAADPDLAAEAANIWAEVVSQKINELYGTSADSLAALEEEIVNTEKSWNGAQAELDEFLAQSSLQIYPAQLAAAESDLEDTLREIERNRLLLIDVQLLRSLIQTADPEIILTSGMELSLINLQARVTAVQVVSPLQIEMVEPTLSLEEAASYLEVLEASLVDQNQQLAEEVDSLKDQISELAQSLEEERYQEAQLKLVRDQAKLTFAMSVADLEEAQLNQNQEETYIKISSEALPPQAPVSANRVAIISFASVSAALLAALGSLFQSWWVKKDQA